MGRPSRGGNICVAQHQPDGVRLLLGRALSLRETLGRLSSWASLVLGDFNTHSTAWGSRKTNGRGRDVQDWAAALDLRLMNRGSTSTCVAWRGESIVDLTWASPAASRRVSGWGVSPEETLSDHLYILMEVAVGVAVQWATLHSMRAGQLAHREGEEDSRGGRLPIATRTSWRRPL